MDAADVEVEGGVAVLDDVVRHVEHVRAIEGAFIKNVRMKKEDVVRGYP